MHKFKQGATFALPITVFDGSLPFDINGYAIESHLNDACGNLIEVLTVEKAQENNKFLLKSNNTFNWTLGYAILDIKLSLNGNVTKSESFSFQVIRSETP